MSSDAARKPNKIKDGAAGMAHLLNTAFENNNLQAIVQALKLVMQSQNVKALAENTGMRRDGLYKTFNGEKDPQLSRVLKLFDGLDLRIVIEAAPPKAKPPRPKLGRPSSSLR